MDFLDLKEVREWLLHPEWVEEQKQGDLSKYSKLTERDLHLYLSLVGNGVHSAKRIFGELPNGIRQQGTYFEFVRPLNLHNIKTLRKHSNVFLGLKENGTPFLWLSHRVLPNLYEVKITTP